eukprot:CAMPEP_0170542332 /NCGR_PEP_ID=MMETSP0211-20121228/1791_1 /TAXON_ID=311385 /ORGANISM="Pseudokeronopsis sp., Strain OXSARD2" /LENGTH=265 /DNA_ID=CAMNT_0010845357 /DNA_START=1241 /DNA_END=2039 /DNA_ORIENTATION=+
MHSSDFILVFEISNDHLFDFFLLILIGVAPVALDILGTSLVAITLRVAKDVLLRINLRVVALVLHLFLLTVLNAPLCVGFACLDQGGTIPVSASSPNRTSQSVRKSLWHNSSSLGSGATSSPTHLHPLFRAFGSFSGVVGKLLVAATLSEHGGRLGRVVHLTRVESSELVGAGALILEVDSILLQELLTQRHPTQNVVGSVRVQLIIDHMIDDIFAPFHLKCDVFILLYHLLRLLLGLRLLSLDLLLSIVLQIHQDGVVLVLLNA